MTVFIYIARFTLKQQSANQSIDNILNKLITYLFYLNSEDTMTHIYKWPWWPSIGLYTISHGYFRFDDVVRFVYVHLWQ